MKLEIQLLKLRDLPHLAEEMLQWKGKVDFMRERLFEEQRDLDDLGCIVEVHPELLTMTVVSGDPTKNLSVEQAKKMVEAAERIAQKKEEMRQLKKDYKKKYP